MRHINIFIGKIITKLLILLKGTLNIFGAFFVFDLSRLFLGVSNLYTSESRYFIIIFENKHKNNLISLKNYFKDYNYQFLPL